MNNQAWHEKIAHPADVLKKHWGEIVGRCNRAKTLSIDFLPELDDKLWGLQKQKLIVVGARPSQGKSCFLLQMAYSFARQGKVVYFFSFEMTKEVCIERLLSAQCRIDNWQLRTGMIKHISQRAEFLEKYECFYNHLDAMKFVLIESIGNKLPEFNSIMSLFHEKPDVVIIDYGNLASGNEKQTRKEIMDEYIKGFRALAVHNDFCGIIGAQVNRSTHDGHKIRKPSLWELKDTGELEQVADVIFLLHWEYFYGNVGREEENNYWINVAKNRDGRTGKIDCFFYPQYSLITDVPIANITKNDKFETDK